MMIKFVKEMKNGSTLLGFGLSDENISRLKEGKPIYFHLDELGIEGHDVLITYGETEDKIMEDLKNARIEE